MCNVYAIKLYLNMQSIMMLCIVIIGGIRGIVLKCFKQYKLCPYISTALSNSISKYTCTAYLVIVYNVILYGKNARFYLIMCWCNCIVKTEAKHNLNALLKFIDIEKGNFSNISSLLSYSCWLYNKEICVYTFYVATCKPASYIL